MARVPMARDPSADLHLFNSSVGTHLLVVDGSRIYDLESSIINEKNYDENELLGKLKLMPEISSLNRIDGTPLSPPPLSSISLIVAQACNMSCGYCYADTGKFGGASRMMELNIAQASVERLIAESAPDADLTLGYMGGEPLLNREVVHEITRYAAALAKKAGRNIQFSITTNATLLRREDIELFKEFPFTVSVSIDGTLKQHDTVRQMNDGSSSYAQIVSALNIFNDYGRPRQLSARVTVTPKTGALLPVLDHLICMGFDEVGFAPVIVSPVPSLAFSSKEFEQFLEHMIVCGKKTLNEIIAGRPFPFSNFHTALSQIHRGTHHPYPCGAGAAYLSVNAEGKFYACHRLIDDPKYAMGDIGLGSDITRRSVHLANNHVDTIEPCRNCWARYLCGGGCYHEVSRRGRVGCDYIRGWLDFCLQAYTELTLARPEYVKGLNGDYFLNDPVNTFLLER